MRPSVVISLVIVFVALEWSAPSSSDAGQPTTAPAQSATTPAQPRRLQVFLDCDFCFEDYMREEITFVEYVRDTEDADVHVLITTSQTGSGGTEFAVAFIGQEQLAGIERSMKVASITGDSEDQRREMLARTLIVGLLGFATANGVPPDLDVSVDLDLEQPASGPVDDPWNNWVFTVDADTSLDAEETQRETQISAGFSVDRVTDEWIVSVGSDLDFQEETFDLDEDEPVEASRRERQLNWVVVKSLGEHWSAGTTGEIVSSTFENTALSVSGGPAIEYNLFPYSEYTRRQFRILYTIGGYRARYHEETLFGRTKETLGGQEFSVNFDQRERWGTLEAGVELSNYLPGFDRYRLEFDGEVDLRLARGLSLSIEGGASRIRDQISLPRRGASLDEVLLRLRELSSGYEYQFSIGFEYTFGSIFNTIVNPRFGQ